MRGIQKRIHRLQWPFKVHQWFQRNFRFNLTHVHSNRQDKAYNIHLMHQALWLIWPALVPTITSDFFPFFFQSLKIYNLHTNEKRNLYLVLYILCFTFSILTNRIQKIEIVTKFIVNRWKFCVAENEKGSMRVCRTYSSMNCKSCEVKRARERVLL